MKNSKKLVKLLPIFLVASTLVGCGNSSDKNQGTTPDPTPTPTPTPEVIQPMELQDFATQLSTNKNYTYTYEFSSKDRFGNWNIEYKYEDKFTGYGMYSKALIETSETNQEIGYAINEKDGAFKVSIDENGNVIPGRSKRNYKGEFISDYTTFIKGLYNLKFTDYQVKPFEKDYKYQILNKTARDVILESTQIISDATSATLRSITIDLNNSKKVEINGDLGENNKFTGIVTNIGTTEIPEIKAYLDEGKGQFIQTEVDPKFQSMLDSFHEYNYETYLYEMVSGSHSDVAGRKRVYKKSLNDTEAIAVLYDYNDENTTDLGFMQLTENGTSKVYNFEVKNGSILLGNQFQIGGNPISTLDEIYLLPDMLRMLSKDKLLMDYNDAPGQEVYYTDDILILYDEASYFGTYLGFPFDIHDGIKEYTSGGIKPVFDGEKLVSADLIFNCVDTIGTNQLVAQFDNFGKVNLPIVDQFLEARVNGK